MKKYIAGILCLIMLFSLSGCGKAKEYAEREQMLDAFVDAFADGSEDRIAEMTCQAVYADYISEHFFEKSIDGELDTIEAYIHEKVGSGIRFSYKIIEDTTEGSEERLAQISKDYADHEIKCEISDYCKVTIKITATSVFSKDKSYDFTGTLELVKEDGNWKIYSQDFFDVGKGV